MHTAAVPVRGLRVSWLPPRTDALLAAFFVAITVAEALLLPTGRTSLGYVVVAGAPMVGLAWRRRAPILVAVWLMLTNLVVNPQDQFSLVFALAVACFTLGYDVPRPRSYVGLCLVAAPYLAAMMSRGFVPSDLAAALVFLVAPWVAGDVARQRAAQADAAILRAEQLERAQAIETELAAERERTRIARELHDIVSHSISVVAIQSQAVRRRLGPEHAREAADLAAVESTAREALGEMRRLLGVLRADEAAPALAPQPGLADLDRLLDAVRAAGLAVRHEVGGTPYPLPAGVDLAAYRILQEAVTNALRHAGASTVAVRVRYAPGHLALEVSDDGRGLGGAPPGNGLRGLRERVSLYGGAVDLSSPATGGVTLAVTLPVPVA